MDDAINKDVNMMSSRKPSQKLFTEEDLKFLSQVLGKESGNASPNSAPCSSAYSLALDSLLQETQDKNTIDLDLFLDLPAVKTALLDETGCLKISPQFYFYILIRDVLKRGKVFRSEVCLYLAELLAGFSKTDSVSHLGARGTSNFAYLSDMMIALQKLPPTQSYQLQVHLGNYSLFMTGIFHERIEFQSKRHGAPSLRFYESVGQNAYRVASSTSIAKSERTDHILHDLSDGFHEVRVALNQLMEKNLHFHGESYDLDAGNTAIA